MSTTDDLPVVRPARVDDAEDLARCQLSCWREAYTGLVEPDRELARVARERGWQVEQFRLEVPLRERVPMPARQQAVAMGGGAATAAAVAVGVWWWRRRIGPTAPAPSWRRRTPVQRGR